MAPPGWPHRSWFVASDRIPRRCLQKEKRSKDDAMAFSNYWMKGGTAMGSDEDEPWHQPVNDANDATFGSDSWPFLRNSGLGFFRGCSAIGEGVFNMILAAIQDVYTWYIYKYIYGDNHYYYCVLLIILCFILLLPLYCYCYCYYHYYYYYSDYFYHVYYYHHLMNIIVIIIIIFEIIN